MTLRDFYRHQTIIPNRLWLNIGWGGSFYSVGIQHRIADPPATPQTCHHSVLVSRIHGVLITHRERV